MKRWFIAVLLVVAISGGVLWTGTEPALAQDQTKDNWIAPDSPFYFMDRWVEDVTVLFLSEEKKVNFYLQTSAERFTEAVEMQKKGKSNKASKAYREGLQSIGKALGSWKRCLEQKVDLSELKTDLKEVVASAKQTFERLMKEWKPQEIGAFLKELADLTKEQVEVLLH